ncbi:MAG: hypothetical protein JWQ18_2260, partial [Conexibacter sp.]|nr:hypothetical protein [Conexibacter sp.]
MSRVRSMMVGAVAACALVLVCAAGAAWADDPPPDLSLSRLACAPENAVPPLLGTTRPGDFVLCQLQAANLSPTIAYHVTADISIPDSTVYDPQPNAQGVPTPADHPAKVTFDESKLGLIDQSSTKPATIRLRVVADAVPGAPILPVATVRDPKAATVTAVARPALAVMPQKADLTPTTTTCANADATRTDVRAGDTLDCQVVPANLALREDATSVTLSAGIPRGTSWAAGGNDSYHFGSYVNWFDTASPGGVPSGTTGTPLHVLLTIDPSTLGGTLIYFNGTLDWTNALSGVADSLGVGSGAIFVTPGPAVLSASTLSCVDDDGPPLVAQDLVDCTVNVRPAAGHEDLAGAVSTAAVPALTGPVTPVDGSGRIPLVGAYGAIAAGTVRTATYRLRVSADAVQGNVIVPTALVTGRSTPSDVAISQPLVGNPLVV